MFRLKGPRFPLMPLNGARSCLSIVSSSSGAFRLYPSHVDSFTTSTTNISHSDSLALNILCLPVPGSARRLKTTRPSLPPLYSTKPRTGAPPPPPAPSRPMTREHWTDHNHLTLHTGYLDHLEGLVLVIAE